MTRIEIPKAFFERLQQEGEEAMVEHEAAEGEELRFVVGAWEQNKINEWRIKHKETCRLFVEEDGSPKMYPGGASGGTLTYKFTHTGIGLAIEAECGCGEVFNATDYRLW